MRIELIIPAIPVAQPRPRAVKVGKHAAIHPVTRVKDESTGTWKDHPITAFKATVRLAAQEAYKGPPLNGALRVDCIFVFPREQSKVWKTKPMPRYPHIVKPDRDNCDKAVLDALKGTIIREDSLVCDGRIQKWRAAGDEQPHVEIVIETLEGVAPCAREETKALFAYEKRQIKVKKVDVDGGGE